MDAKHLAEIEEWFRQQYLAKDKNDEYGRALVKEVRSLREQLEAAKDAVKRWEKLAAEGRPTQYDMLGLLDARDRTAVVYRQEIEHQTSRAEKAEQALEAADKRSKSADGLLTWALRHLDADRLLYLTDALMERTPRAEEKRKAEQALEAEKNSHAMTIKDYEDRGALLVAERKAREEAEKCLAEHRYGACAQGKRAEAAEQSLSLAREREAKLAEALEAEKLLAATYLAQQAEFAHMAAENLRLYAEASKSKQNHDEDCPCFGDEVEHTEDCLNCECPPEPKEKAS